MSKIERRKNESFEAFFRRVKQQWMKSGIILQAKKIQFFEEKKSKNERKKKRVHSVQSASKKDYLQKIGRLPQDDVKQFPSKR